MKLISKNINNSSGYMRYTKGKNGYSQEKFPKNSDVSFGAKIPSGIPISKIAEKFKGTTQILTKEQCGFIDKVIGDNFFSNKLAECGYDTKAATIEFKQPRFITDLFNTIKYPFTDMWLDIGNAIVKNPKKGGVLDKHLQKAALEKSQETILNIVSQFDKNKPESFASGVAKNLAKTKKNYRTRDERTLNRILTATVSSIYSANDFYNISMLQKDDKSEARKAGKSRFKQEFSRMALSAGLTFITMGALNKHIKNNMYLSAASIAISTLISEIGSRIYSKTPLKWLTPQQAKEIALKNSDEKSGKESQNNHSNIHYPFEANSYNVLFKDFAQNDGTISTLSLLGQQNYTPDKKEDNSSKKSKGISGVLKTVAIASLIASAVQIFSSKTSQGKNLTKALGKVEDFITNKKTVITGSELDKFKGQLSEIQKKNEIPEILQSYSSALKDKDNLTIKSNRFLIAGLYNGTTKIFKTIYTFLSAPGKLAGWGIDKLTKKPVVTPDKATGKIDDKTLGKLYEIFKKNEGNNEKILNEIKNNTRNFEECIETGDLANFSRTLVTLISSYFFINDYRNKVLIESKGQDVDGAESEMKQRLSHKLANFIINGTIMNVGNSVFKGPLNNSLSAAGLIAVGEEVSNEFLVRKSICQPITKKGSKQEILDFEEKQLNRKGLAGAWSRLFRKITGKKTLTQKAGIDIKNTKTSEKQTI